VISEAYKVLKVTCFHHIATDNFHSFFCLCNKTLYEVLHLQKLYVFHMNDLIGGWRVVL